ncbi:thyrotropin-releasing hormone receptor-like [Vespula maculifrons]|uniref:Thyrotropin-releasing hormone receptor-like n=1 Tax=Vespula maculifrons TaxID=7453 RepID=A0ABD2CJC2_VESMC
MFWKTSNVATNSKCIQISATISALPRVRRSASSIVTWTNVTNAYVHRNVSFEISPELEEEPLEACSSVYFLLELFHMYYIPAIILLGLVGNLLSCVVFLNTHLKMRSSSYYLAALATADFGFLVSLLLVWLNNTVGWMVFNKDGWCETLVYVSAVCSSLSVWLIVAFTVERFIAVQYPLHRPHMCTIARAKAIVLILVILALASHSYAFVTAGVVKVHDGYELCDLKIEYLETMRIISIIDSIASLIAPLVLIIIMNTMIMRNLLRFTRRFKQAPSVSTTCPSRERSEINLNQIPKNLKHSRTMEIFMTVLTILAIGLALYYFRLRDTSYFKEKGLLHDSPLPIFGNMAPYFFRRKPVYLILADLYNKYSQTKYFGFYDFMSPVIVLRDPEIINSIGIKNFDNFCDHTSFVAENEPLMAKNLFQLRGDTWREMRKILSPTFTSSKMKMMFGLVQECAENFVNHIAIRSEKGWTTEMKDIFTNYTNDSASSSHNGAGGINMGTIIGGRRPPSQQSFHSSKTNHSQNSRHQPTSIAVPPSTPRNACQLPEIAARCIHVRSSSRNLVSTRNQQSITKMLLLISTVFIILNSPSYVIRLCVFFFTLARRDTPALLWCLQQFFMLLYYTNFSINFLLYAMCGITFRRCLEQLLRKVLKSMTRYHCNPQRYI